MKKVVLKVLICVALYKCGYKAGNDTVMYQIKDRAIALTVNPNQTNNEVLTPAFDYLIYGNSEGGKYTKELRKVVTNDSILTFYTNRPQVTKMLKKNKL